MMRFGTSLVVAFAMLASGLSWTQAQNTVYWDINGTDPGAGNVDGFTDGVWGTDSFWSPDPNGEAATGVWVAGDHAVFSAGDDAVDHFIEFNESQTVGSLTIEDGIVHFSGGVSAITIGAGPVRVNQGATLSIPNLNVIGVGTETGHVLTLDGGTLRNTIVGFGSGIYPSPAEAPTQIQLTSNGGTLDTPNGEGDAYSIMLYGTATSAAVIGMTEGTTSATLTKTGPGEFRGLTNWTFTALNVQEGLYRINGSGGTDTGFGDPNGTVSVAGGAVENTTNGAALGTTANLTDSGDNAVGPSPATRSFVLAGPGDSMFVLNNNWQINGPISGPGGLMLNGWARNDGGGTTTSVIGTQNILTLAGTNTYAGLTTINFGTLAVTGGSAIPDSSQVSFSTRSVWGGNNGGLTSTFDTAVLRIDDSETIGSLAGGNSVRGSVNLNGADVTLSVGADDSDATYDGGFTGDGGLTKVGTGTQTLTGANIAYTGDTAVEAGTLSISNPILTDAADVYLTTGALLDLDFADTDVIDSLFIDNVSQEMGTWGAIGNASADFTTELITGAGLLQVSTFVPPGGLIGDYNNDGMVDAADYTVWRDNVGAATLPFNRDPNNVGVVGDDDYNAWVANFGMTGGAGAGAGAAVPEPASLALAAFALAGLIGLVRRSM